MKTVTILGATGSVGTSTLDLVEREPDRFKVRALTANCDVANLAAAAIRTRAELAVVADESCLPALGEALAGTATQAAGGRQAVCDAAAGADWTMGAIVGCAGLEPVMAAIAHGGTVVLANKEPLVSAGEVILAAAARSGATLLPADSEHNAIYQCFDFARPERVRRIILTASGGPFRDWPAERMAGVTVEQAVAHPNWSMGAKISVDSATMMNKGLELIEAARLFPVPSAVTRWSMLSRPAPWPPLISTARAPRATSRRAWATIAAASAATGSPRSTAASGRLGVIRSARGSSRSRSVATASSVISRSPLVATITGSRTTGIDPAWRARPSATAAITAVCDSMPIFTALTARSENTLSICRATKSAGTSWMPWTPVVFCAVSAVITLAP